MRRNGSAVGGKMGLNWRRNGTAAKWDTTVLIRLLFCLVRMWEESIDGTSWQSLNFIVKILNIYYHVKIIYYIFQLD